jgi:UDP-2,4-diacetamido-2,4,6-trideoxy-beta-L-altropyranose hydrolase
MKVVIRVDASQKIGLGHVMRCLALAEGLYDKGATINFIIRDYSENLNKYIKSKGFKVNLLPKLIKTKSQKELIGYEQWLGTRQEIDADYTIHKLIGEKIDWLIVDHYALDCIWEKKLKPHTKNIMVIDDLANRIHDCDILLDQTFGRNKLDYKQLVPSYCQLLLGSKNALLRPDFKKFRSSALQRRKRYSSICNILVSMGGMDEENITLRVLDALSLIQWKTTPTINIVLTAGAPYLQIVNDSLHKYDFSIRLLVDVNNMAELMLESDIAIGAGGSTSWERCCLALPTVLIILSENQQEVGKNLAEARAVVTLQKNDKMEKDIKQSIMSLIQDKNYYIEMCNNASKICDGSGVKRAFESIVAVDIRGGNGI